jgi:hypothetical protein
MVNNMRRFRTQKSIFTLFFIYVHIFHVKSPFSTLLRFVYLSFDDFAPATFGKNLITDAKQHRNTQPKSTQQKDRIVTIKCSIVNESSYRPRYAHLPEHKDFVPLLDICFLALIDEQ